jgi:hypothetical protein
MSLSTSLLSYWKLDESSGNATDSVGSNTLTNTNTVTYTAALINNGATFSADGTMYLTIANASENPTLDITGAVSYQAWVKKNGAPAVMSPIMMNGDRTAYTDEGSIYSFINTDGTVIAYVGNGVDDDRAAVSTGTVVNNAWHHIVVIFTPSTSLKIYIDGSEDGSNTTSMFATAGDPNLAFQIGHVLQDGTDRYFGKTTAGQIDECAVWNRAITTLEVTQLYNDGAGLQYPFTTPTSIKTINGLAVASVKVVDGLAIASVKTFNGLA